MEKSEKLKRLHEEYGELMVDQELIVNRINQIKLEINKEMNLKLEETKKDKKEKDDGNSTKTER
jgi:hypothetical protein